MVPEGVVGIASMLLMMFYSITSPSSFCGGKIEFIKRAIMLNLVT